MYSDVTSPKLSGLGREDPRSCTHLPLLVVKVMQTLLDPAITKMYGFCVERGGNKGDTETIIIREVMLLQCSQLFS